MGCGCGGAAKGNGLKYEVTRGDGTKLTVNTLSEAQVLVRRLGGTFKAVTTKG
jgi:hypothetical protein